MESKKMMMSIFIVAALAIAGVSVMVSSDQADATDAKLDFVKVTNEIKSAGTGATVNVLVNWESLTEANAAVPQSVMDALAASSGVKLSVTVNKNGTEYYRMVIDSAMIKHLEGSGTTSLLADFSFPDKIRIGSIDYTDKNHIVMSTKLKGDQMFEITFTLFLSSTGVDMSSHYDHKVMFEVKSYDKFKFYSETCFVDENCCLTFTTSTGGDYTIESDGRMIADETNKNDGLPSQTIMGLAVLAMVIIACAIVLRR